LIDVLLALSDLDFNIVVTLPSDENNEYIEYIQHLCVSIYCFDYHQWMDNRDVYAWSMLDFADIIGRHAVDIVHANTIVLLEPIVAARQMGRTGVVHVRELISLDEDLQQRMRQTPDEIVNAVRRHSDWRIGNSLATCELFGQDDQILYVPNAVTLEDFDIENVIGEGIRFGIVSSNIPKKGIADFVEVARRAAEVEPRAQFVIVGPSTQQVDHWMMEVANGERPDNLVFVGYKENARAAMQEINVLLNLSTFAESFGRTVAEAMASARPVIAYRWGALPELVQDGESGYLVPFFDIDGVLKAVLDLCAHEEKIISMGQRGREFVAGHFSQQVLRDRMAEGYERITGQPIYGERPLHNEATAARLIGAAPPTTIIIPVHDAVEEVRACIASVLHHTDLRDTEVMIIDDASSDPAIGELLNAYEARPGLRIFRASHNQGYTRTVNLGIKLAAGRDVILLNSDTIVTPRWLEGLRASAYSRPMVGTVTAMSDNAGAFSFPIAGQKNERPDHLSHEQYALLMVQATYQCPAPAVPTGSGFCLFMRRAMIDAVGLFDVDRFPRGYGEENEFCMRAMDEGWQHLISPWSFVYHVRNASFKGEKEQLLAAGLARLTALYPNYDALVRAGFSQPALTYLREASAGAQAQARGIGVP